MKLSKKICFGILIILIVVGLLLFFKAFISTQNSSNFLQEANTLLINGRKTQNDDLIHQAISKLSIWLEKNWNNPNQKLVAKVLRSRANAFIVLNETTKAINDYNKSIQYDPIGKLQLVICNLEKEQGDLSNLQNCYIKAVNIFVREKASRVDIYFLIAKILSGDKTAIVDYKNVLLASTEKTKIAYRMEAEAFLDKATYEKIIK